MAARPPVLRYSHDNMIDQLIAQPRITQNELAGMFGYSPTWVSTIMCSDAFKAKLEHRREEIVDPELRLTLEESFRAVTQRSLQVLMEKLDRPASVVPDGLVLKAMELGAKSLGMGQQVHVVQAPPADHLEHLAERLVALQRGLGPRAQGQGYQALGLGPEVVDAEVLSRA